jgi:hypothetical protein
MLDIIKAKAGSRQQTARRQQKRDHTVDIRKRRQEDDRTKQAVLGGRQQTKNSLKYAESRHQWQAAGGRRQTADGEKRTGI